MWLLDGAMGVAYAGSGRFELVGPVLAVLLSARWHGSLVQAKEFYLTRPWRATFLTGQRQLFVRPRTGLRRHRGPTPAGCASPPRAHGPRGPRGVRQCARSTQIEPAMQRRPGTMELTINNRCGPSPGRPIRRCPLNVPPVVTRYRLGRKIGSGSFGDIYLATNIVRYRPAAGILPPFCPAPPRRPRLRRHPRGAHACLGCAQRRGGGGQA